jgi:transposase
MCRANAAARRLAVLPGVGPIVATALVAAVNDGRCFRSGRELAAWIGLVPRQYTTGGKPKLGGIGRRANHYLRRQMIPWCEIGRLPIVEPPRPALPVAEGRSCSTRRKPGVVALANKTARIAWAILVRGHEYAAA